VIAQLRRSTELGLIVLAALITGGAYALASLGRTSTLPADLLPFLAVILGLLVAAHLGTRAFARGADGTLLPLAALLNGLGYVMIARVDTRLAGLQATWTFVGVGAYIATLFLVRRVPDLARYKWTFALVGLGLLLLPSLPGLGFGAPDGARLWVNLGPVNFQPGEFAKIALALFFAAYLTEHRELLATGTWTVGPLHLPEPRHLAPLLVAWIASLLVMVSQKDLGSSLLFFALFVVLLWVATERLSWLLIGTGLFGIGAFAAWSVLPTVHDRVAIWLDPWSQRDSNGFQVVQSVFALAWGKVTGSGLGLGDPTRIPAVKNDFIFAAFGEELGLLGGTAIIVAYLLMVGSGLRIAIQAERTFEKLLATGLTTIIGVQAFVIIGGVTRVVPLTGVTLPFVSYGGSSLLANYILLALLMRIADSSAQFSGDIPRRLTWRQRRAERRARRADATAPIAVTGATS
jgi:cell division protein FtsW (lipid II flippase)